MIKQDVPMSYFYTYPGRTPRKVTFEKRSIDTMTAVGVTGHQGLTPNTEKLVADAMDRQLRDVQELVGITSLAEGADQIFAERVLAAGGQLTVILPAARYALTFPQGPARQHYEDILSRAERVIHLPFDEPAEEVYWAAGKEVVDRCDLLLAVWNGKASGGLGGTADVVAYARKKGRPAIVIWPPNAARLNDGNSLSSPTVH